jgi:hypothetical protein
MHAQVADVLARFSILRVDRHAAFAHWDDTQCRGAVLQKRPTTVRVTTRKFCIRFCDFARSCKEKAIK